MGSNQYTIIRDKYKEALGEDLFDCGAPTMTALCFSKKLDMVFMEPNDATFRFRRPRGVWRRALELGE